MTNNAARNSARVLPWIVGLFALAGALVYAPRPYEAARVARWPTVTATIVNQQARNEFAGYRISRSVSPRRYENRLRVRYSYEVGSAIYSAVTIGPYTAYVRDAPYRESQYAVGTRHPARYDPARPSDAVLESPSVIGALLSLSICVGAGLWALTHGAASRSAKNTAASVTPEA
jgi:hypothetical protein